MHDLQLMKIHNSLHNVANNESTLKLIKKFPLLDIFIQVFSINVLSYDIFMSFAVYCIHIFDNLRMVQYFQYFTLVTKLFYIYLIAYLAFSVSFYSYTTFNAFTLPVLLYMHLYTIENLPVPITSVVR